MVSKSNCFLRWGCPENVPVDCSEDGGRNSSLINDISMPVYTASWFGRLKSSAVLMYANSDKNVQSRESVYILYVFHVRVLEIFFFFCVS